MALALAIIIATNVACAAAAGAWVNRKLQWWDDEVQLRVAAARSELSDLRNAVFTTGPHVADDIYARASTGPWAGGATQCYSNGRLVGYAWADGAIRRATPAEQAAHERLQRDGVLSLNVTPRRIRRPDE